jgi:signal transduction histidine kinase
LFGILKRTDKGASLALVNDAPRSARATIERSDLTEALGNVLDNAVRYAKTTVRVSCQGDSEPLAIVVEDDAPGIAPNLEAIIRQRGGRLDEKGGLGLSLVQDILDAYRWRMDFGSSTLGGLSLRLAKAQ